MAVFQRDGLDGLDQLDAQCTQVLSKEDERELLRDLAECREELLRAYQEQFGSEPDFSDCMLKLAELQNGTGDDSHFDAYELKLLYRRYHELRSRLALANLRLVAHVAKRYQNRGIAYSDLLQDGFCGLLEAIDRFDLNHSTKLGTYATWWIRQAMQRAVASGAYPVKLSPRHLRQLARSQSLKVSANEDMQSQSNHSKLGSMELLQCVQTVTRPTVSLNASLDGDSNFSLLQMISEPEVEAIDEPNAGEMIARLICEIRPREQQVLQLRFGLGGRQKLSLSQVGNILSLSKERVRQIQDRALQRLRELAEESSVSEKMSLV